MHIYRIFSIFFLVTVSLCTGISAAAGGPDLCITDISGAGYAESGDCLSVSVTVANRGTSAAGLSEVAVHISDDPVIGPGDACIGKSFLLSVPAGSKRTVTIRYFVPGSLPAGRYYLGAEADASSRVTETDEENNWAMHTLSLDICPSPGTISPTATLTPATHTPSPTQTTVTRTPVPTRTLRPDYPSPGRTITMPSWFPTPRPSPTRPSFYPTTRPWRTPWTPTPVVTIATITPAPTPTKAVTAIPTQKPSARADLVISGVSIPDSAGSGKTFDTVCTVKNQGGKKSAYCEIDLFLSDDAVITDQDTLVGSDSVWQLDSGDEKKVYVETTLPVLVPGVCYWIGAIADPTGFIEEGNEGNNASPDPAMLCVPLPAEPTAHELAVAAAIVDYTNIERKKAGVPVLTVDEDLAKLAMSHSDDMRRNNFFSHDSPYGYTFVERVRQAGYFIAGENVAATMREFSASSDPDVVGQYIVCYQWMRSSGHRKNILEEMYRTIGVGSVWILL